MDRVTAQLEDAHALIAPDAIRALKPLASSQENESNCYAMTRFADHQGLTDSPTPMDMTVSSRTSF